MELPIFGFDPEQFISLIRSYVIQFVNFFVEAPLFAQILMGAGIFALIALSITLVYYIVKGIYLLIKAICKGIYKLGKKIYNFAERKIEEFTQPNCPQKNIYSNAALIRDSVKSETIQKREKILVENPREVRFCSSCGTDLSEKFITLLTTDGRAFCEHCGRIHEIAEKSSQIKV